jgi:dihydrofolate synthase/folylpolyglutamate synthase
MTGSRPSRREEQRSGWTQERAEEHLRSVELFGMRFGLDRMRRMMTVLGAPQGRLETIHVLGTNGKSSTTRMIAAILERRGLLTGSYTSPHLVSYRERIEIGEREIGPEAFAEAVAQAAWAAERVNRTLTEDDHVTQFELLTAAALWEMAERRVDVAVVEAGLGGRYDATSVIESRVTVLTNVGLEHTRWLGPTVRDIAEEKLAVVRPGATLVLGPDLREEAREVADRVAAEQGATVLTAPAEPFAGELLARGRFQRRNFALARTAAEAYLSSIGSAGADGLSPAADRAAAQTVVRGRLEVLSEDPLVILDGAHNPDAVAALAESLPELVGERPLGLVLGVLEDKDAARMLDQLLPLCTRAWFTAPPSSRALSPAALASLARQQGFEEVVLEPKPARALAAARHWAGSVGGAVLASGSVYLVGELVGAVDGCDSLGPPADRPRGPTR